MKLRNINKLNKNCHPEVLTEGSIDSSHSFRMTQCETGRSMVEMLGVLAVIGVLSVAGIAGYTMAMNKYRANELLNEASKRAAIVAMQMASGKDANIDEFKVNGTQDFTVSGKAGDATFTLSVANVDEAVCKQLVNAAGTTGAIRKITSGATDATGDASKCTTGALVLTYNADLTNMDKEPELGLKQNVPCGSGFCFEGQTCTDAVKNEYDEYYCGPNMMDGPGKCCSDENNNGCPAGQIYSEYNMSCIECPSSDFVLESNGQLICCQRGTGKYFGGGGGYYGYGGNSSSVAESICCTEQGGFVDGDNYACCKGNMYDIQGRLNYMCNNFSGCSLIGKKSDGKFYAIYESGSFPDGDRGYVDVSEYVEWHRCWCDEADDTEFCNQASEEGVIG